MTTPTNVEFVNQTTVISEAWLDGINDWVNGAYGVLGETFTAAAFRAALSSAQSGANTDITSLSALTTALSISQGGTGVTSLPKSLTPEGYITLPGGLIIQWGVLGFTTGATQTWTFPIPFPTAILHLWGVIRSNTTVSPSLTVWDESGVTLTTAKFQWQAAAYGASVFAIGY